MSAELIVVDVDGGYAIKVQGGELPNSDKNQRFLNRIYKHRHVAVARKKAIDEISQTERETDASNVHSL